MRWKSTFLLLVFISVSACSSATPEISNTEEAEILSSTPLSPVQDNQYHPLNTRTMVEEIDVILNAVDSGAPQELQKFFVYIKTTCMTVNTLGGPPPCRKGEAEGTPVEVMPFLESEGSFLRKDEIQNWIGLDSIGIYAVYEVSDTVVSDENFPAGDYAIALVGPENKPSVILQVNVDGIVRIDYIFNAYGSTLADVIQRDAVYLILAPITP